MNTNDPTDHAAGSLRGRVAGPDRVQRLTIALALMALTAHGLFTSPEWPRWVSLVIQIELLTTAIAGWCPLYWSFGTTSCRMP